MYEYKVVVLQCLNSCLSFSFVVGVCQSCCAFNLDNLQTSIVTDATNQIDSRNHAAALHLWILLHERLHRGTIASAPRPDAVCLALAALFAFQIEGMCSEQLLRLQYHLVEKVGSLLRSEECGVRSVEGGVRSVWFYQQIPPCLIRMVVGRGTDDVLVSAFDDQQMSILNACDEFHTLAPFTFVDGFSQRLVQIVYQYAGIVCLQIAAIVRNDLAVVKRDNVATDGKVIVGHFVTYRCCLQRAATLIYLIQVVA